jgi:hypothetical protein
VTLTSAQTDHVRALAKGGRLTAAAVVADARRPTSPLHTLPAWRGWNRDAAAARYWLTVGREIIQSVQVVCVDEVTIRAPAYVQVGDGDGYVAVGTLKDDAALAREAVIYALKMAAGHLTRAEAVAVVVGLGEEFAALRERLTGLTTRLTAAA